MDITDQPHLRRHMVALPVLICCAGVIFGLFFVWDESGGIYRSTAGELFAIALLGAVFVGGLGFMAIRFGCDEFFALTRRTIRFSRKHGKLYAIRRRRFFGAPGQGDVVKEATWSKETVFCLHKGVGSAGMHYHIRCYLLGEDDRIEYSFAIGREWSAADIGFALAQWNFWRRYMSEGPAALPCPPLYIAEREGLVESFFTCMYSLGFTVSGAIRLGLLPFIVLLTIVRRLALCTCRDPKWPIDIMNQFTPRPDAYDEPRGTTPVGWKATIEARHAGDYPTMPSMKIAGWAGLDEKRNAKLWESDELHDPAEQAQY